MTTDQATSFINVLKHGHAFHDVDNIVKQYSQLLDNDTWFNAKIGVDAPGLWYVYSNECYIFIYPGQVTVRCDREGTFSSGVEVSRTITSVKDCELTFQLFKSMTMEDSQEDE